MARGTVYRFRNHLDDPQRVGVQLNVRAVLTGRVSAKGDQLVVRTELIDVADGSHLWGEQYARKSADLLSLQEEIVAAISSNLRLRLSREEKKRLGGRFSENTEAYHLYLQGRYHWNKRTEDGMKKAIHYFQQTIELDPAFALAYAGLADCYHPLGAYRALPPHVAFGRAAAMATKALEIDPSLAEAHTSLAMARLYYEWDWPGAEKEFKAAIRINSNYPISHQWFAIHLTATGQLQQGLAEIRRAQQLDPFSLAINTHLGWAYYFRREFDQAIAQMQKTLELDPDFTLAHFVLGQACAQKRLFPDALRHLQRAAALSSQLPAVVSALGYAHGLAGDRQAAEAVLGNLQEASGARYVSAYDFALVYLGLGDHGAAFDWLEKAVAERASWLIWLNVEPVFDVIRSDPKFSGLVQRVGLPGGS